MMMSHPAYAQIESLDLASVRARLLHPHAGPGWSAERTRNAEAAYREFLFLAKLFPTESPVPEKDVDTFWHFHILDTMKYARDCASVFGHFLHHAPDTVARHDAPSAARAAMTTNRMISVRREDAAANQQRYCAVTAAATYCAVAAAGSYCAVTQGASAAACETTAAASYCALTQSAPDLTASQQSYCAVTRLPA